MPDDLSREAERVPPHFDNDGFVDALVLRGGWMGPEGAFPLSLLRNNCNDTFTDVTKAAGLFRFAPTQTAAWSIMMAMAGSISS